MILNNLQRNSFLIKETSSNSSTIYILPEKYRVIIEVEIDKKIHKISAFKGEKTLICGTNGIGKSKLFLYLLNDYKSQVFLENLSDNISETLFLTYDEFNSVVSYLCQDLKIIDGTILDNLFMKECDINMILNILNNYPMLNALLKDDLNNKKKFYNINSPLKIKEGICLFRALVLAKSRDILLFDSPNEIYLDEIFSNNQDKCIFIAGHYNKSTICKFDNIYLMSKYRNLNK